MLLFLASLVSCATQYSLSRHGSQSLSSHFKVREFACKDGSDYILIDHRLVDLLEKIRNHFGRPVHITSAYRNPSYNRQIGGASDSQHCKGTAADITVSGVSPSEVYKYAHQICKGGVGKYSGFTHVDVRDYYSRW